MRSVTDAHAQVQNNINYLHICESESADVKVIGKIADFKDISKTTQSIICVKPGDYRNAGIISISSSGTKDRPRYLVNYNLEMLEDGVTNRPVNQPIINQVILSGLNFRTARHWVVNGITLKPVSDNPRPLIKIPAGSESSSIILKNLLLEGGGGGAGQIYIGRSNKDITITASVLRNSRPIAGRDSHCIRIDGARNILINQNEIYNCAGDGVQVASNGSPGTKITNNDIYITSDLYSDCKGKLRRDGLCACAENAIDIKGATTAQDPAPASEWLTIFGNRMWGFQHTDKLCGGTGDNGSAIVIHFDPSDYILIEKNVIHHSNQGITVATYNKDLNPDGTDHVSIISNTLYSFHNRNKKSSALNLGKTLRYEVYFNTIVDADRYLTMGKTPGAWNEFRCNVLIDAGVSTGAWSPTSIIDRNTYYNTKFNQNDKDKLYFTDAKLSRNLKLCFDQRRLTGNETFCIPYGETTDTSPHKNRCTASNTKFRSNIGVDNRDLNEYDR